jgi:hypothetical protein
LTNDGKPLGLGARKLLLPGVRGVDADSLLANGLCALALGCDCKTPFVNDGDCHQFDADVD